jgi:glycosyltransferase involved in cell wall biosynthesis
MTFRSKTIKLSVCLMSFNEEANIRRAIESVLPLVNAEDGEIIVLDSFSADNTVAIAKSLGAKVFQETWKGYIEQNNAVLAKCSGEWVLSLDADEEATPELLEAVKKALTAPDPAAGYLINRRSVYMGKRLKYAWQPDLKMRLARRAAKLRCTGNNPHPVLTVDGKVERCAGEILHYSYINFNAHMLQTINFARQRAETDYVQGRKTGYGIMLVKPLFVFFKKFILKRGFLDGVPGLISAFSSAVYIYMRQSFLWELWAKQEKKSDKQDVKL